MDNFYGTLANLTSVFLNLYALLHLVAVVFEWINSDPRHGLVLAVRKATVPMWNKARTFLPYSWRGLAPMACILAIYWAERFLPMVILDAGSLAEGLISPEKFLGNVLTHALLASADLIGSVLFFLMLLLVVWFFIDLTGAPVNNPFVGTIYVIVEPLLAPVRRWLPSSRIDVSPLVCAVLVYFARSFLDFAVGHIVDFIG